jgi:hypothetical protein
MKRTRPLTTDNGLLTGLSFTEGNKVNEALLKAPLVL